jgi:hypothetical protein
MKNLTLIALASCIGPIFAYVAGAFVVWDLNPGNWRSDGRYAVALLAVIVGFILSVLVSSNLKE